MVLPKNWGMGGIWMGYYPVTDKDIEAYKQAVGLEKPAFDYDSLVGRYDPEYLVGESSSPMGGKGSVTYEMQNIAPGVEFAPVEAGKWWIYDGEEWRRSKSREPVHKVYPDPNDTSYWDMWAGPKPNSLAGLVEATGGYFLWEEEPEFYQMWAGDGTVIEYKRVESD